MFMMHMTTFSFSGLQRRQRRVLDTSNTYVRGEENLHGWRPQVSMKTFLTLVKVRQFVSPHSCTKYLRTVTTLHRFPKFKIWLIHDLGKFSLSKSNFQLGTDISSNNLQSFHTFCQCPKGWSQKKIYVFSYVFQGDSLIFDHQWDLEKIHRLTETERTRHFLLLREKLGIDKPLLSFVPGNHHLDKSEKEACNLVAKASGEGRASPLVRPPSCGKDPYEPWEMSSRERDVANKYLRFMTYHSQRYQKNVTLLWTLIKLIVFFQGTHSKQRPNQCDSKRPEVITTMYAKPR